MTDRAVDGVPEKRLLLPPERPLLAPGIICSHFSVHGDASLSFLAWQERMDPVYDLRPSSAKDEEGFAASLRRYSIGNLSFFDIHTSPNVAERSLGRVSTESACDLSFSLFLDGTPAHMKGYEHWLDTHRPSAPSILVQDLGQPCTVRSFHGRMLIFFVPRALVEEVFPDAASLHGRRVEATTPLTRMLVAHLVTLNQQIVGLSKDEADSAFRTGIQLLATAFSQQAGLCGNARAAVRAAVYGQVRRYVEAHLHDPDLSPERVLQQLHLSRASVYSLFAHEGGLAAYIRSRRLRAAASDLVRFPHLAVKDIAFGLGFNNASSFTRAFRRAYDMAPQDLHAYAASLGR
ncbi:helix-turn-helix domain-containing protein [Pseudomonas sp. MWU12-2037]|uniref:helix-turn-helix domain-containing protein n=1 Tax=Pseudomonas sp. MWU12-2037 TaxID=2928690 RepID=UPI00200CA12C|nr:helix-turn-helix domain-containing protein [Pseudomonas sp. MWU12-2037]